MIELSPATRRLLEAVIRQTDRERIAIRLGREVSENIPQCENGTPESMERIRFSVIRLLGEGRMNEDGIFRLAAIDWRDLFLAADHGQVDGHERWARGVLGGPADGIG